MRSQEKEQDPAHPGPQRDEPTPGQRARLPDLQEHATQAAMLGAESDLFLEAARFIQHAQSRIEAAMAIRQERNVAQGRPGRQPADAIVALEDLEQAAIAFVRRKVTVNGSINPALQEWLDAWSASSLKYSEPVNRLIRSARCLLSFAEDILRSEVRLAVVYEDVPVPGETREQILDRLLKTELGLTGIAAQRLRNPSEGREDAGRNQATRRAQRVEAALSASESAFAEGFNRSDARATEADLPLLEEIVRKGMAFAATIPGLDAQVVRVTERAPATPHADVKESGDKAR